MGKHLYLVSWNDDETEFAVLADDQDDAKERFLKNRKNAGALGAMEEDADGRPMKDLVHCDLLVPKHGHDVFEL